MNELSPFLISRNKIDSTIQATPIASLGGELKQLNYRGETRLRWFFSWEVFLLTSSSSFSSFSSSFSSSSLSSGQSDYYLTNTGRLQAQEAGKLLAAKQVVFDKAYSSDLVRCVGVVVVVVAVVVAYEGDSVSDDSC